MLQKLIRDMKFDTSGGASMKQRLLLLLDEFPQLGNLKAMELALAVCAGYGIKVCIVAHNTRMTQNTTYCTISSYPPTIYSGVNNANLTVFAESVTSVLPLINAPFPCYAV